MPSSLPVPSSPIKTAGKTLIKNEGVFGEQIKELGEDFAGYGPARLHDEKAVQEFASFLKTVDLARLQERVNFREMSRIGVYGVPFGRDADADFDPMLRAEVAAFFPRLRDYVGKMAEKQNGLLIWLS